MTSNTTESSKEDFLTDMGLLVSELGAMSNWLQHGKETVERRKALQEKINKAQDLAHKMHLAYEKLKLKIQYEDQLNKIKDLISASQAAKPSYSMMTSIASKEKVKLSSGKVIRAEPTYKVSITPAKEDSEIYKTSDDTKNAVLRNINPKTLGVQVKKVTRTAKKSVIIESTSQKINCLIDNSALANIGLTAKKVDKYKPRLIIFNVPAAIEAEEMADAIYKQNDLDQKVYGDIKPAFKFGKDPKFCHWVVEVTPKMRTALKDQKIFIGWNRCKVEDHIQLMRCFKCLKIGHLAKHCRSEQACAHCASGHDIKDCPNKQQSPDCVLCKNARVAPELRKHLGTSKNCPIYERRFREHISNIDYGT